MTPAAIALCPACLAAIGGACAGPDAPARAAVAGETCGAADHAAIAGVVVQLTRAEADWVDWALLAVAGYFRDQVDEGTRAAAPALPRLVGLELHVDDLDDDVRDDLRYRLLEQALDMASAQEEAGARRMVRGAAAAWRKIAAAWPGAS